MKTFLFAVLFSFSALADVGQVLKHLGGPSGHVLRSTQKLPLSEGLSLEVNDRIVTEDSFTVIYLEPSTQVSLNKGSEIIISKAFIANQTTEKSSSLIDLVKGLIKVHVTNDVDVPVDQSVKVGDVAFAVRGTEFEIFKQDDDVDLDVLEGEVEVSSPLIQTFVPEIVKANEGFRFNRKERKYLRRKFASRFKDQSGFLSRSEIRQKWKKLRQMKKKRNRRK